MIKVIFPLVCMLFIGCGGEKTGERDTADKKELLAFVAAGIQPPVAELVERFTQETGVKVITDFAGSEVLLSKLKLSRQGDVYIPGDRHYVDMADSLGFVLSRRPVFYWVPTILVQKGNPKAITGLQDLIRPGLSLGLGNADACAIGRTTLLLLKKNGIEWKDVEKNLKFHSVTVNELGMQIQTQSLDAVIVWDATANYYARHGDQIPIPVEKNIISTVDAGVLKFSINPELAKKLVDYICSERSKKVFRKFNYTVDAPG